MGRELKRVPLDFDAPRKTWKGFINPHTGPCECVLCEGSGYNVATKQIADDFFDFNGSGRRWRNNITQDEVQALVYKNRLWDFTRIPLNDQQRKVVQEKVANGGNSWLPYDNGRIPTADEVNEWSKHGIGHDAINRFFLIEARAKRLGVFGKCPKCRGKGWKFSPHVPHRPYNAWKEYGPPEGDGYQLWENTTEGSPVSPVFPTAQELAQWCENNATIFGSEKTSYENWMVMFNKDELAVGSLLVSQPGYFGALANAPK